MMKRLVTVAVFLCAQGIPTTWADLVLIDENFAGFTNSETYSGGLTVTWSDNDTSAGFERYDLPGGGGARQTDGDYDHDDDGGAVTPQITLLAALEVNDDAGNMTLTGQFVLPAGVGPNDLFTLMFGADARNGTSFTSTVELENITDGRFALATSSVVYGTPANNPDWKLNDFSGMFIPADAGDTFELRFTSTGGGGDGLQITELYLNAVTIPEPSATALLVCGLAVIGVLRRQG